MLLVVFLCIILFLLILLFSNVYISIQYMYEQTKQHVTVSVFILRIKVYKKSYDLSGSGINEESTAKAGDSLTLFSGNLKSYYEKLKQMNATLNTILKPFRLHHFTWNTAGGTGNAAATGIMSGGLWTVKNVLSLYLMNKLQVKCKPAVHLEPNFQHRFLYTNLDCMLSIRLGKAIYVFTKRKKYLQSMKEALQTDEGGNE